MTRVCEEMSAKSPFPDGSYSSYEDYFLKRHKFCLKHPNSPLLEVEPFQVVSDNLKPRYVHPLCYFDPASGGT